MQDAITQGPVPTPCVGVCSTVYGDRVCRGCKRFAHEIIRWNGYSEAERAAILMRLEQLTERIVAHRFRVADPERLEQSLRRLQVRYQPARGLWHRVAELVRTRADRIGDLAECGVEVLAPWNDLPLGQLRDHMEEELIMLAEAYLQRYFPGGIPGAGQQALFHD